MLVFNWLYWCQCPILNSLIVIQLQTNPKWPTFAMEHGLLGWETSHTLVCTTVQLQFIILFYASFTLMYRCLLTEYAKLFWASPDISSFSPDIWLNLTTVLRRTFPKFAGHVRRILRTLFWDEKKFWKKEFWELYNFNLCTINPNLYKPHTHKTKGAFGGAEGTIWRFSTLNATCPVCRYPEIHYMEKISKVPKVPDKWGLTASANW